MTKYVLFLEQHFCVNAESWHSWINCRTFVWKKHEKVIQIKLKSKYQSCHIHTHTHIYLRQGFVQVKYMKNNEECNNKDSKAIFIIMIQIINIDKLHYLHFYVFLAYSFFIATKSVL